MFLISKHAFNDKFYLFLVKLELRLSIIIIRARFSYKYSQSSYAIKRHLILVNGEVITKTSYVINLLDLIQKRKLIRHPKRKASHN